MSRTIPHHVDQNEIDREVDNFFAAGARLTKALFRTWLESQAGAVEVSKEIAPAQFGQRLMTVKEVAEYLQVKEDTVYLWVKDGTLRCRRVKGEIRFKFEELEEDITPNQKTIEKARLRMVK